MTSENHSRTQQTAAFPKGTFIGLAVLVSVLAAAVLLADYFGDKSPPYRRAIALTGMICGIQALLIPLTPTSILIAGSLDKI